MFSGLRFHFTQIPFVLRSSYEFPFQGVTIPSQRRYVGYYATLVQETLQYQPVTLVIREIRLEPAPLFNGAQGGNIQFTISEQNKKLYTSPLKEVKKGAAIIELPMSQYIPITGDVKVEFFRKTMRKVSAESKVPIVTHHGRISTLSYFQKQYW